MTGISLDKGISLDVWFLWSESYTKDVHGCRIAVAE